MRRVLLLIAIVAAVLFAWWLLREEAPAARSAATRASAPPSPAAAKPASRAGRVAAADHARNASPTDATPASQFPGTTSTVPRPVANVAASESGGELLVVDASTGSPLAGVKVGYVPFTMQAPLSIRTAFQNADDPVGAIVAQGATLLTDAEGKVRLPRTPSRALVAARHGGLRGTAEVSDETNHWRLELSRPVPLTAIVEDAEGRPCGGVTVIFLDECEYGPLPAGVAVTDATDGAVRFEDVSTERRRTVRSGSITVALPFVPPLLVPVDLKSPATAPVRLRLPPTGRVRCEVVDQTGSPAPDGRVVLLRNPAIDDRTMWRTDFSSRIDDARATTSAGAAVFEHVGRDVALEVEIPPADDSQLTVKQRFAGPKAAGETVVLRVALGGARPAFVGRVVDAAKTPVAGLALVAEIAEQGGSTSAESKCTTDDDGRFRFAFDRVPGPAPGAKLLVARPFSRHSLFRDLQSLATIDLPDAIGDGEKDVGTIVCDSARPLVAGVVVDDADRPLAGVAVSVVGGDSDDATTDSDGRFQIIGNPSPSRLIRLGAALDGRYVVAANSDFAAGTTDARIVMAPSGGLAGSVQVPADRPLPEMRVVIVGRPAGLGDGRSRDDGESCFIKEDGRFEAPTLRPGDARVEFRRGFSGGRVLLAIDHVKIESGSITRDPRLQLVDVAKLVNGPTITVVDADGRPVRRADVQFRLGPGGAWQSADSTDARGATLIPTESIGGPESMFDVVVTQFGFNTTSLHDVTGDQTIILPKAARSVVHLRLASSSPLPAPPSNLSAELLWIGPGAEERPRSGDPRNVRAFGRTFSKDREMTLEAAPGRYRVQLMLLETEFNESMISSIGSVPKSIVVTVGTDGAPAEAVIGVDPDELKDHQTRAR